MRAMSAEDTLQDSSLGVRSAREDLTLGELNSSHSQEQGRSSRLHTRTLENCDGDYTNIRKSPFQKALLEAESAANAASIQLVSFKDAMEDEFAGSRQSVTDKKRISRQRGLLLEKLEHFKQTNKSVRQKLKELQAAEDVQIDTTRQIDVLVKKITQAESENVRLSRDLCENEKRVEELLNMRIKNQEEIENAVQMTKTVEYTRAHLQGQLRNKEADNNQLTVQLQTLERTLIQQKMEVEDLKGAIVTLSEQASQDKEALKKATRAQKQRAERFEASVDKYYTQIREKDAQLANACSERDSCRRQYEQMADKRQQLITQTELLKSQSADLAARLQRERDEFSVAKETVMHKIEKLNNENGELNINNATLKVSIAELEKQLTQCQASLVEESLLSQQRKHEAQQNQMQVADLQAELDDLKIKYQGLLREMKNEQDKQGTEAEEVRQELQGRIGALEAYPGLLRAAEQRLVQCQENLRCSEHKCSQKSESIRRLQVKMDGQTKGLKSSVEMKESIHEANLKLHEKIHSLQNKVEASQQQNLELVRRLAAQDEVLSYSNRQLDQRSAECQTLNRQLEAALLDIKLQVNKVKDSAVSREGALQAKILALETQKSRREAELKRLRQTNVSAEKLFEVQLKDLQLSLDQSESHKQSIQNYIDFLKNSYSTMFDEGVLPSSFGSSYFLK